MKKRLRTIAALTAVMVCFGACLPGCTGKQKSGDAEKDDNTFTYWAPMPNAAAAYIQSMNELDIYQELEKRSGIHIEFIHPPVGQDAEQFNLMIASGDLPDMIEYYWNGVYTGGADKAVEDGVIIPLNDYLDDYAPNYKKALTTGENAEGYRKGALTDNHNYYAFLSLNEGNNRVFNGYMFRGDWLEELNLPVPKTIDEWTTALRRFRDEKGASVPLTGSSEAFTGNSMLSGAFGISTGLYLDNNKVKYGPGEPEYKQYVQLLRDWYSEKFIDNDYPTNNNDVIDSKILNGNAGVISGSVGATMGTYLKQMAGKDEKFSLVAAPMPVLNNDSVNNFAQIQFDIQEPGLAITKSCRDVKKAIKWADYLYSEDGYNLMNFGIEGTTYNMDGQKHKYTDLILNNPQGHSVSEALSLHTRASYASPGMNQAADYLDQYYQFESQKEAIKLWGSYSGEAKKITLPSLIPLSEESDEYASLKTNITTYVEEMTMKFIIGSESMDNFDKFTEKLKTTFQLDKYVSMVQKMYDRYLER